MTDYTSSQNLPQPNYEGFKRTVKILRDEGIKAKSSDLYILSPQNDPFACGTESQIRDAEWFADVYAKAPGAHLRRVHYRILDLPEADRELPVTLTTKKKGGATFTHYENHERCWYWLTNASKYARYLGLVPSDAFVDNRAKEASFDFNTNWVGPDSDEYVSHEPGYEVSEEDEFWRHWPYSLPDLPDLDYIPSLDAFPRLNATGYTTIEQPYHIEIWAEKSEGEDIILPLCRKYNVNFVPGVGDMSLTTTYRFVERVRKANKPAVVLYVADFDPSGYSMPIGVARKIEFILHQHNFDCEIALQPIMLTEDQVKKYDLPGLPVKDSDKRKEQWESQFGSAVELNAMFANEERIGEAQRIIEQTILEYYDTELQRKARLQRDRLQQKLYDLRQEAINNHSHDINHLDTIHSDLQDSWEDLREEFAESIAPFRDRVRDYQGQLDEVNEAHQNLYSVLLESLQAIDFDPNDDYPLPEAKQADTDDLLYDSVRSYWEQMIEYKHYKDIGNGLDYLHVLAQRGS